MTHQSVEGITVGYGLRLEALAIFAAAPGYPRPAREQAKLIFVPVAVPTLRRGKINIPDRCYFIDFIDDCSRKPHSLSEVMIIETK